MILGMLRVKNEGRWIARCIASLVPICDRILLMDDHSTDDTLFRACAFPQVDAFESKFDGINEARDKNHLLELAEAFKPEWIVAVDGDEMFSQAAQERLLPVMAQSRVPCIAPRIWYLWDTETQVRTDGVYGDYHRASIFRPDGTRFPVNGGWHNFHCGNVPPTLLHQRRVVELDLLHFGYLHRDDRLRKYDWYRSTDPDNAREDNYRHLVIGDVFPAESKFMHGGPLTLRPLLVPSQEQIRSSMMERV